jgi:MFS family permease
MKKNQKYQRNLPALTFHTLFSRKVTAPVFLLFYLSFGLTFSQIGVLSGAQALANACLQLHGGAISDTYGRKFTSLLYGSLATLAMIFLALGSSFNIFLVANILFGNATAIGSGNGSALLFDTLTILGKEKEYKKFRGKVLLPAKLLLAVTSLVIPALYLINKRYPFLVGIVYYALAVVSALFLTEPPRKKSSAKTRLHQTIGSALKEIKGNPTIRTLVAAEALLTGFTLLSFEYFQALLQIAHLPVLYFGIVYATLKIIDGAVGYATHTLGLFSNSAILKLLSALIACTLLWFSLGSGLWLVAAIISMSSFNTIMEMLFNDSLNKEVSPQNRTTIMSTTDLVTSAFLSLMLLGGGILSDTYGVREMFSIAAIGLGLTLIITSLLVKRRKSRLAN